jgi:LysM repeat protein
MMARLRARLLRKTLRRRATKVSLVLFNIALLLAVIGFVALNPVRFSSSAAKPVASTSDAQAAAGPVDQLASATIAVTAARMVALPETAAVINQADTQRIEQSVASANNAVVNKPQSVSSAFVSNKDIHAYTAQAGDTVSALASKFGVTSDSIVWSNNLASASATLTAGTKLFIPPTNGIVYTVKSGDTPSSLAATYHSSEDKITAYNDAEIGGLHVGEQIIIPDGSITPVRVSYGYSSGFAWGSSALYGFNGYDYGNCTWYVATQISVPGNWGNAATWAAGARAAGWHVSSTPTVGAIAQTPYAAGGLGHVAIVDAVSDDGTQIFIRDMNGINGFGRVGTAWRPTSSYPNYITR